MAAEAGGVGDAAGGDGQLLGLRRGRGRSDIRTFLFLFFSFFALLVFILRFSLVCFPFSRSCFFVAEAAMAA